MKVILMVSEDVPSLAFLREGAQLPGSLSGNNVVGRFVACTAFVDAVARYGTLDYALIAVGADDEGEWQVLADRISLPLVRPGALPKLLADERIVLHELARHKLGRLALLRQLRASSPAPVTAQLHGLGSDVLVEDLCVMLLSPLSTADTIFCPSAAAEQALTAAIDCAHDALAAKGARVVLPSATQIPLAVDTEYFRPLDKTAARRQQGIAPEEFVFLSLGRLSPSDKFDHLPLLHGMQEVIARAAAVKKVRLIIAGSDKNDRSRQYVDTLAQAIQCLGLHDHVTLRANFDAEDRLPLFSAADVFLGLSDAPGESFGLAVVEALACGLPVIAADWDGYRQIVKHGINGFTVPTVWSDRLDHLDVWHLLMSRRQSDLAVTQSVAVDIERLLDAMVTCATAADAARAKMSHEAAKARVTYSWRSVIPRYEEAWRRLAATPAHYPRQGATPLTRRGSIFRSYPSCLLGPGSTLVLSERGERAKVAGECFDVYSDLTLTVFDEALSTELLNHVGRRPAPVEDLIARCAGHDAAAVRWHVLWLLKQGYLRRAIPQTWDALGGAPRADAAELAPVA